MSFYSGIAPYYDLIFPYDDVQIGFLRSVLEHVDHRSYLDIGCATGTILSEFTDRFHKLTGIDLEPALLERAAEKMYPGEEKKVELLEADIRDLSRFFQTEVFSFITCLGNTIPHLTGPGEISEFFRNVWNLLEPKGVFVFQTVNYDRILDNDIRGLPVIEQNDVTFERYYSAMDPRGLIDFDVVFNDPSHSVELKESVRLLPVRKNKMEEMITAAGFPSCKFYGDYSGTAFAPDSFLLIGVCSK